MTQFGNRWLAIFGATTFSSVNRVSAFRMLAQAVHQGISKRAREQRRMRFEKQVPGK
ncbi:MAG: hypothetical protein U0Q11_26990 [Vicinamibacterales bacterium]